VVSPVPGKSQHQDPHSQHHAESEKHDGHIRAIRGRHLFQAGDLAVELMGENQTSRVRNRDLEPILGRLLIRPCKHDERRAGAGLPMRFHRRDLDRLVLKRIEAMQITDQDLQRRQQRCG
jgi:hypothetical protein